MKTNAIRIKEYGGPEVLNYEEVDLPALSSGEDAQEGIAAFLEKRKPNFKG